MSRHLGRDVPDVENFMQENFGLIFRTLKADTEIQYRHHIAITETIADAVFADAVSETSKKFSNEQLPKPQKVMSKNVTSNENLDSGKSALEKKGFSRDQFPGLTKALYLKAFKNLKNKLP